MSGGSRQRRLPVVVGVVATLAAVIASVAASPPRALRTGALPLTAAADHRSTAHPAFVAVPAAMAVAGAADPGALYVLYAASARGAGPAHVERVSRPGPGRLVSAPLPAGADLVRAGDSLWVTTGALPAVYRLDPQTLAVRRRIDLPAAATALAATPEALWLGGPGRLTRIALGSGAVTADLPVDGEVTSLSADPAGRHLYAATAGARGVTVSERDAHTGAVTASHRLAPGPGHVAATPGGVWVWQDHATAPARVRLRQGDLRPVAGVAPVLGPGPLRGTVVGALLWVGDRTSLSCADPLTGRVRATWASPPPDHVVAADPTRVALVAGGRLVILPNDARCR